MPPAKSPGPDRPCVICGEPFTPQNVLATTCSPACQRERRRRRNASWYEENAERHKAAVVLARRRRKKKLRKQRSPAGPG